MKLYQNNFNPRAPCGARRNVDTFKAWIAQFQSTRPVWGATIGVGIGLPINFISIHAPRVGRDGTCAAVSRSQQIFQSTRPVWGATVPAAQLTVIHRYFNPRAPCGARRRHILCFVASNCISIHAPRVGRDRQRFLYSLLIIISIHAPRVGRDSRHILCFVASNCISIHAPRVGRDSKFDDFTPSNLHKRYKRVLARPKNTREKGKIKQKLAYIHAFSAFLGCEGSGTFCALVLRTQYR